MRSLAGDELTPAARRAEGERRTGADDQSAPVLWKEKRGKKMKMLLLFMDIIHEWY